jgi:hypothetical protein
LSFTNRQIVCREIEYSAAISGMVNQFLVSTILLVVTSATIYTRTIGLFAAIQSPTVKNRRKVSISFILKEIKSPQGWRKVPKRRKLLVLAFLAAGTLVGVAGSGWRTKVQIVFAKRRLLEYHLATISTI